MIYSSEFNKRLIEMIKTRGDQDIQREGITHLQGRHSSRTICSRCGTEYGGFGRNMFALQCSGCEVYMFLVGASVFYSPEPFLYRKQSPSQMADADYMAIIASTLLSLEDLLLQVREDMSDLKTAWMSLKRS